MASDFWLLTSGFDPLLLVCSFFDCCRLRFLASGFFNLRLLRSSDFRLPAWFLLLAYASLSWLLRSFLSLSVFSFSCCFCWRSRVDVRFSKAPRSKVKGRNVSDKRQRDIERERDRETRERPQRLLRDARSQTPLCCTPPVGAVLNFKCCKHEEISHLLQPVNLFCPTTSLLHSMHCSTPPCPSFLLLIFSLLPFPASSGLQSILVLLKDQRHNKKTKIKLRQNEDRRRQKMTRR